MNTTLAGDLARLNELAFTRVVNRKRLVEEFHSLDAKAREHRDYGLLQKIYAWAFVPLSLWPIDLEGPMLRMLQFARAGRPLDERMRLKCRMLQKAPAARVCRMMSKYEQNVSSGSYEMLIAAQHKFDQIERKLWENPELRADWEAIKRQFDVDKYRNRIGVIRRRPVQERNFHPGDWKFGWSTEAEQFHNVFDVFCHRWDLYGVQKEQNSSFKPQAAGRHEGQNSKSKGGTGKEGKPRMDTDEHGSEFEAETEAEEEKERFLLLKLTVNITPYGTMIMIPRYWSFDPRRDLKWSQIKRLHRLRSATKQGRKLSVNEIERRLEAEKAREYWEQATAAGLKGDGRDQWVMGRLGWDPRTDESKLRRVLQKQK